MTYYNPDTTISKYTISEFIDEFGLKTGRTDRFIKTVKIDSSFTID